MEPLEATAPTTDVSTGPETALSTFETEVINVFVSGVRVLGLPKSVGEIYGLLFISPSALSFDEILAKLSISKGSTSQGLRFLRSLGAVRTMYVAGARRDYFTAETELKKLVGGFIRGELLPHLDSGSQRLAGLESLLKLGGNSPPMEDAVFLKERIGKLKSWHSRSRKLLPIIEKFLS